jgi:hypothetical protein
MSIRRMMIFALGGSLINTLIQNLKDYISTFSSTKEGTTFEAETCLNTDLTELSDYELLDSANLIITPNNYSEIRVIPVKPLPLTNPDLRNLIWRSQGKTTGWSSASVTAVVFTGITDPFGGVDVVRVTETVATAAHTFNQNLQNYISQRNSFFVLSSYLRKGTLASAPNIMQLSYGSSFANFNLTAGTVTFSGSVLNAGVENAGSGWYRCIMSGNTSGLDAVNNPQVFIGFVNNNPTATARPSYGGATTRDVYVYGTQFELSTSATTYQRIDLYPQITNNFSFFNNATLLPYRTNSNGLLQNIPYENIIYPSIGIATVANGNTWRWIRTGLADTSTGFLAPDGTLTASRMDLGGSINSYYLSYQSTGTSVAGESFTIPKVRTLIMYVKQGVVGRYLGIDLRTGSASIAYNSNATTIKIDTSNGSLANNPTAYTISYSSQFVSDGWYKICIVRADAWNSLSMVTNSTLASMANSTNGVLIWRVQVVDGIVDINTPVYDREIGYSIPRLDYSGTSTCPDYLIERAMTNTLLQSENYTAANWVKTNLSVSATTFLSPTNNSYSNLLIATGSTASVKQSGSGAVGLATPRIFSVYLQRKTGSGPISLSMGSASATTTVTSTGWTRNYVVDSPRTGTYTSTSGNYTITTSSAHGFETGDAIYFDATSGVAVDASIASITVTGPTTFTFTTGVLNSSGNCTIYSNSGKILIDTSGDEVYAWGGQIEFSIQNATVSGRIPSSYIPTTTAQVSRSADLMVSNISGSTSSSFYIELSRIGGLAVNTSNYLTLGNEVTQTLSTDSIGLAGTTNAGIIYSKKENSGAITNISNPLIYTPTENKSFKTLITISGNSINLWMDGSLLNTTTFANPSNLRYLIIDGGSGTVCRLSEIVSWPTTLTRDKIDLLFAYPYYNAGYTPANNELQQVINRAYAEGFTLPSTTILGYCDTLITEMKNDNVWDFSDVYFNFAYNDLTLTDWSRINWKNPYGVLGLANVVGTITYQTNGFKSAGTGGYIDTRFVMSQSSINFKLNNAGSMIVQSQIGSSLDNSSNYVYEGSSNFALRASSVSPFVAINSAFFQFPSATGNRTVGLKALMRDSSTDVRMFANLTNYTHTQASTGLSTGAHILFSINNPSNDSCVATHWLGASLTNTQITNFRTYYNTFLTNIGLTSFA